MHRAPGALPPRHRMHHRLLSFLSDLERAITADDPQPGGDGVWSGTRIVNYHLGLARLSLQVRSTTSAPQHRGVVTLQSYALADGTPCLKATLGWAGHEAVRILPVFTKPGLDWTSEARKIAAHWLAGPPESAVIVDVGSTADTRSEAPRLAAAF
jgi:hypothetical protein